MLYLFGIISVIVCFLFLGYIWLEVEEKNTEKPEAQRKWSDPKNQG